MSSSWDSIDDSRLPFVITVNFEVKLNRSVVLLSSRTHCLDGYCIRRVDKQHYQQKRESMKLCIYSDGRIVSVCVLVTCCEALLQRGCEAAELLTFGFRGVPPHEPELCVCEVSLRLSDA